MSFSFYEIGSYWRPHELDAAVKHLGPIQANQNKADILLCRTNTETVTPQILSQCLYIEDQYEKNNDKNIVINSSRKYSLANNKDACFKAWKENSIPHPECVVVNNREDIEKIEYPYLLRLNDGVTGEDTYLVESDADLEKYYPRIKSTFEYKKRIDTKIICVKYIDTSTEDGFNLSYRIVAAGNKVICGYARISDDWLAITKQFSENKKEAFIRENKKLENILNEKEDLIVRALKSSGHQHAGLDVIPGPKGEIYFLEVQPFYFCGNTNRTMPPFWNPYKPKELVNWLISDEKNLKAQIPTYYEKWLNKKNHFDSCYKAIRNSVLDVWPQ